MYLHLSFKGGVGLGLEALQPTASCFRAGVASSLFCISKDSGRQKHITLQWKKSCAKASMKQGGVLGPCWHQLRKHWCTGEGTVVKSCHLTGVLAGGTSCLAEASPGLRMFSGGGNGMHLCCVWQLSCIAGFPLQPCTVKLIFFTILCFPAITALGTQSCCMSQSDLQVAKKTTLHRLC